MMMMLFQINRSITKPNDLILRPPAEGKSKAMELLQTRLNQLSVIRGSENPASSNLASVFDVSEGEGTVGRG